MVLDYEQLGKHLARRASERGAYAVMSIDGTILDTRPRSLAILQSAVGEFPEIKDAVARISTGVLPRDPIGAVEQSVDQSPARRACLYAYWRSRFFDDAWLEYDVPYEGAAPFLHGLVEYGLQLVYLSYRDAPTMSRATREAFQRHNLPMERAARFIFKQSPMESDSDFTERTLLELAKERQVGLAIERSLPIANLIQQLCPRALVWVMQPEGAPTLVKPNSGVLAFSGYRDAPRLVRS
jgi:hypothetical protein